MACDRVYVAYADNNRVLYFQHLPPQNGQTADGVIGQLTEVHTRAVVPDRSQCTARDTDRGTRQAQGWTSDLFEPLQKAGGTA